MAFSTNNLTILGGENKNGVVPSWFSYYNEDGDTVTTAGYFVDYRLNVGDQIFVLAADYAAWLPYKVTAVSSGAATVVVSTTPA
jgi:hypothetical protein